MPADGDTSFVPANGATWVGVGKSLTVTFNEPMDAATITRERRSSSRTTTDATRPGDVSYNSTTNVATLTLQGALEFGSYTTYGRRSRRASPKDLAGNPIASERELVVHDGDVAAAGPAGRRRPPTHSAPTWARSCGTRASPTSRSIDVALITPAC